MGGNVASGPAYVPAPSYGYGYPGYPTIQGPAAGRLNGTANLVSAYGQYSIDVNQARLANQQVEQEKRNVMIVGHLPFFGRLAALLLTGNTDKEIVAFQFGCVVSLKRDDSGRWKLEWMMVPELL